MAVPGALVPGALVRGALVPGALVRGALVRGVLLCLVWSAARALPRRPDGLPLPRPDVARYFIDYSYLQRDYPCSAEERECFAYGRLLHGRDGKCYRAGERGPCGDGEVFHADKAEAQRGGRFRGVCSRGCPQPFHVRLAATAECVSLADLSSTVCGSVRGLRGALDPFGQAVCACEEEQRCDGGPPPPPRSARHPYAGRCAAPDVLSAPRAPPYRNHLLGLTVPCSAEEFACLARGLVLAQGECHALRTRGPCAPAEWLVLNRTALYERRAAVPLPVFSAFKARLQPVCEPRPCEGGRAVLATERRCRPLRELRTRLCSGEALLYDVFGRVTCDERSPSSPELPNKRLTTSGHCIMDTGKPFAAVSPSAGVECVRDDAGSCVPQVKHIDAPLYYIRPEDD